MIESIFSQFMYKTLPTCNHLFVFKKQFCMQMALSGTAGTSVFNLVKHALLQYSCI